MMRAAMQPPAKSPGNRDILQEKQGGRLSRNGQSPRGIRDLDNFSKANNREKQGDDYLETGGVRFMPSCPASDHFCSRWCAQKQDGWLHNFGPGTVLFA